MKITFCGAARAVTGSCHLLEVNGHKILVDCGLQQGKDELDNDTFPFAANSIDYVIITHAHIDHSGRVPKLIKEGFGGEIITTRLTAQLLGIMLRDSAHIQESDAAWENQKGKRAGRPMVEPLYTMADAEAAISMMRSYDYDMRVKLCEGVEMELRDAGHLLGSSTVTLWLTEGEETRRIVFSGDLGNKNQPIIRDPVHLKDADYVVIESTYGNRDHLPGDNYTHGMAAIFEETFAKGGNVIIPSFAVGRTQELLYFIRAIKKYGLVKSFPDFPVYVDSPLAKAATSIFAGDLHGYIDEEAQALVAEGEHIFIFPGLHLTETSDESRALNDDRTPKVIISASGMCDAGRIRHHLKHNLWKPECTVVFVGFQVVGSLGRQLSDGAESVKLFGEEIAVRAKVILFKGLSGHADRTGLLEWLNDFAPKPKHVFVVHGDSEICQSFAEDLRGMGYSANSPEYTEEYDLISGSLLKAGFTPERKKHAEATRKASAAYTRLLEAGKRLMDVIVQNRGASNKDLAKFADQVRALIDKWGH